MYDVSKRPSKLGNPTLSTVGASQELALNGMSVNDLGNIVPMNLYAGTSGNFELMFEGMETFSPNATIYVKDLVLNIVHNIADGNYSFSSDVNDVAERFEIIFVPEVDFTTTNIDCEGFGGSLALNSTIGIQNRDFEILNNNTNILSDNLNELNTDLNAGNYTLNVNDQYGGTQVYNFSIESAEQIVADFSSSSLNLNVNEVINLNSLTNNADNILWFIGNDFLSNIENLTYSFEEAGVYDIVMTVSNEDCSDSKSETITVSNKTTGIGSLVENEIEIYPNPVKDVINIVYQDEIVVEIYTILGKKVLETEMKTISVKDFASGIYVVHILNNNDEVLSVNKLVKE